jgi:tripartite ATP-independent transporter DctM subunit
MSEATVGLIGIFVLMVLIFLRMNIGLAMALVGFGGFAALAGLNGALSNLSAVPYRYVADYNFVVIPLFLLMGSIAANTGISRDLYTAAHSWVGQLRGGLAMATVSACAFFAAICGSSTATAAAMGKVALPEMERYKYAPELSTGCVAAGGTMGILIPPSLGFILYAILTEESVGKLFMAGILPGVLEAVFYIVTIYILCLFNPRLGPAGPRTSLKSKLISLKNVWSMLSLFVLVIGGIYLGIFTPSEAAAIGAFGALIISLVTRRFNRISFIDALAETGRSTAMIFLLVIGAMIFQRFLAVSKLPFLIAETVGNLNASRYVILGAIIVIYIILGCFLDIISALVLTIPIMFPTIVALGFHPIWFGVLFVRMAEIGLITPPVGMNCFVIAGVTGVPLSTVFRGIVPFFVADIFHVALLVAVPGISLFLPSMMMR